MSYSSFVNDFLLFTTLLISFLLSIHKCLSKQHCICDNKVFLHALIYAYICFVSHWTGALLNQIISKRWKFVIKHYTLFIPIPLLALCHPGSFYYNTVRCFPVLCFFFICLPHGFLPSFTNLATSFYLAVFKIFLRYIIVCLMYYEYVCLFACFCVHII